jgi:hypothetical protein
LEQRLGRDVPLTLLFQHPTVNALADALGRPGADETNVEQGRQRGTARRAGYRRHRPDRPPAEG